jgi:spore coat polysaccharide biosynthesis protein SpsF (cytidylyltransferase family)
MAKFKFTATLKRTYELTLEGEDDFDAWQKTYEWLSDDFDEYETDAVWDWEAVEEETNG